MVLLPLLADVSLALTETKLRAPLLNYSTKFNENPEPLGRAQKLGIEKKAAVAQYVLKYLCKLAFAINPKVLSNRIFR